MSSLSSRVGLTLMADGDFVNPAVVSNNSALMDSITSATQAMSTSRPGTPFDGQWIYETDTQNLRRWSATDNKWYLKGGSGLASAKGRILSASDQGPQTVSSPGGQVALISFNATLIYGHEYKIVEQGWYNIAGGTYNDSGFNICALYLNANIGSAPGLNVDSSTLLYQSKHYRAGMNGVHVPFYRTCHYFPQGGSGNVTCYFKTVFSTSSLATGAVAGHPNDVGFPTRAWIYDLGVSGSN